MFVNQSSVKNFLLSLELLKFGPFSLRPSLLLWADREETGLSIKCFLIYSPIFPPFHFISPPLVLSSPVYSINKEKPYWLTLAKLTDFIFSVLLIAIIFANKVSLTSLKTGYVVNLTSYNMFTLGQVL